MSLRPLLAGTAVLLLAACARGVDAPADVADAPQADPAPAPPPLPAEPVPTGDPRIALAAKIPGTRPEDLRATPVPGIYEIVHEADISYVTADAAYVFSGDLFRVTASGDFPNLSDARRRELRLARLSQVPESEMLVFGASGLPHTVTVFTDIDCPWCQRLHSQIAQYNEAGIRVRYMFFPRSGPDTESWYKAEDVWCAQDRKDALTRAKQGKRIPHHDQCPGSPVAASYRLGRTFGLSGTPGVVLENGELIPGYVEPRQLAAMIDESLAASQQAR